MPIVIFSRSVHSGKTTELQQWCKQQENVAGILMPDIGGSRKILDLNTNSFFEIECTNVLQTKESLTAIGRFHFYSKAFLKANAILNKALSQQPRWLIIDEVGKLELDGKGFHPAITEAVEYFSKKDTEGTLVLTVRESLVEDVISFYGLRGCKIISSLKDI